MQRHPSPLQRGRSLGSIDLPLNGDSDDECNQLAETMDAHLSVSKTPARSASSDEVGVRVASSSAGSSPLRSSAHSAQSEHHTELSTSPDELAVLPAAFQRRGNAPLSHASNHSAPVSRSTSHHRDMPAVGLHASSARGEPSSPKSNGHRRSRSEVPVGMLASRGHVRAGSGLSAVDASRSSGGASRPTSFVGGLISGIFGMRRSDNDLLGGPATANASVSGGGSGGSAIDSAGLVLESRPRYLPPKDPAELERQMRQYDSMVSEAKRRADKEQRARLARQDEKDRLVSSALQQWTAVLPQFEVHRRTKKLRDLWWQGLPPSLRGRIWGLAIGNDLHITRELFEIFLMHARNKLQTTTEDDYYNSASMAQSASPPSSRVGAGWARGPAHPHVSESSADADKLSIGSSSGGALLMGRESSVHLICLDVSRTFPSLGIFQGGGPYYDSLRSVLEAYVCYRPDVGYVQGMSFLASMFLLNMDVVDAFTCMTNLLNKPLHMAFYRMDMNLMAPYLSAFMVIMEQTIPSLHAHMVRLKINPDFYMIDWILTMFSKALPLDVASRVWDVYFCYGDPFVFRTALGIFRLYLDELLSMEFEEAMEFITHLPQDVSDTALFHAIGLIQFTERQFSDALANEKARLAKNLTSSKGSSSDSITLLSK
eukprot:Opistho-2@33285